MGSFADEAFGPEPGSLIQVQDPIPRPAPIVRPGEGGYAAPRAAAPVVEPPPAPPAGDNSVKDWVRLMQKHGVPHSQMPDLSEYYYDIDRKGAGPRPGMSPELDADIRFADGSPIILKELLQDRKIGRPWLIFPKDSGFFVR